jgi:hypothetical protein
VSVRGAWPSPGYGRSARSTAARRHRAGACAPAPAPCAPRTRQTPEGAAVARLAW